jgi:hypothetical protein
MHWWDGWGWFWMNFLRIGWFVRLGAAVYVAVWLALDTLPRSPVVSTVAAPQTAERRSFVARAWSAILAAWGAATGVLPHVLHHVGPLAGAAFLAGAGGRLLFAGIALVVSVPFLLRIYRRFRTWVAPAIAFALFAAMFSLSSFVIGPAIAGEDEPAQPQPGIQQPAGHEEHH